MPGRVHQLVSGQWRKSREEEATTPWLLVFFSRDQIHWFYYPIAVHGNRVTTDEEDHDRCCCCWGIISGGKLITEMNCFNQLIWSFSRSSIIDLENHRRERNPNTWEGAKKLTNNTLSMIFTGNGIYSHQTRSQKNWLRVRVNRSVPDEFPPRRSIYWSFMPHKNHIYTSECLS